MRARLIVAAVPLLLALAGCGDSTAGYCAALEQQRTEIADMVASDSSSALLGGLPMLHDLADAAPEDVADEWRTLLRALDRLDDALRRAGVEPGDFRDGKPPAGLSEEDRKAITAAAAGMGSPDVVTAASGIEQQARDVCKINLGL